MPLLHTTRLPDGAKYSEARAERVIKFIEGACVHTKSTFAHNVLNCKFRTLRAEAPCVKKHFLLENWQSGAAVLEDDTWTLDGIIRPLFGAVRWSDVHQQYVRQFTMAWLEMARKNGKALDICSNVLTDRGWTTMGEVSEGDIVYGNDGQPTKVLWVSERQVRPGYRVTLGSGRSIVACDNHKWLVRERTRRHGLEEKVLTTQDMVDRGVQAGNGARFMLDMQSAVDSPPRQLPMDPYVLGAWLGDGSRGSGTIAGIDPAIWEEIERRGYEISHHANGMTRTILKAVGDLRQTGVLNDKHVPQDYLLGSRQQRMDILRGLMDTDGTVTVGPNTPRVDFTNTNKQLAESVKYLALSLGFKATLHEGQAKLNGRVIGPKYRVTFTAWSDDDWNPFLLPRKRAQLKPRPAEPTRAMRDMIVSIEPVGDIEGVCIAVDHPSHTFLAGRELIPTHNSELMAALGLYMLIADGEWAAEVYGAASDKDQASQVFDVARDMIYLSPTLDRWRREGKLVVVDSRKRIIWTPTRSFYRVIAADAAGNLGANPHAILFDEVLAQPDDTLWNVLRQGFGTRAQPMLIGVTTAGPNRESFAYTEHEFGMRVAEDPNLDPKRFVFMAFTDEKVDWRDESHWGDANPALSTNGGFLDIQMLRDEMVEIINKGDLSAVAHFKIFRLNQWGTKSHLWLDINVYDDSEEIAGSFTEDDLTGVKAVAGFDMAETMDLTAWVVVFYHEENDAEGKPVLQRAMVKPRFWITQKAIDERHKKRKSKVMEWVENGYLTVFDTEVHQYDKIREQMLEDIGAYGIQMFAYDPYQAPGIVTFLEDRSSAIGVKIPQLTTRMDPGAKELTRLLGLRLFTANQNPVLRWCAGNAGFKSDNEGHVKPHKQNSTGNIDGITALVNALAAKMVVPPESLGDIFTFNDDDDWEE